MPVWVLIHSDDFSSYTSDADVEAAYPSPSDYDSLATDWGASYGPDGQPGIKDQVSAPARDTGAIVKNALEPTCRGFRVKGRYNFAATNHVLDVHAALRISHESIGSTLFTINHVHSTGTMRVVWRGASGTASVDYTGALPVGVPVSIEVEGFRSTMTETSPGVFTPAADGYLKIWLDGVLVHDYAGVLWNNDNSSNPDPYWTSSEVATIGAFSLWEVYCNSDCDSPGSPSEDPLDPDESNPCCVDGAPPGGPGNPGDLLPPNPYETLPAWIPACAGLGTVPTAPDLTDSENWAQ